MMTLLTNLHVGDGGATYGIIDKAVQRDPVLDNIPIINSSGVKGAIRAHCLAKGWAEDGDEVKDVFGYGDKAAKLPSARQTKEGNYKFFSARMLFYPLRTSEGSSSYALATTAEILDALKELAEGLNCDEFDELAYPSVKPNEPTCSKRGVEVEGQTMRPFDLGQHSWLKSLFKLATPSDIPLALVDSFKDFALPVIARNVLNNGQSDNLWYEEYVPYKTCFYFFIGIPEAGNDAKNFKVLETMLTAKGPVQFGGNATIGYGQATVKKIEWNRS
jgi:CRISPR-associated protein Cmr4